MFELMDAVSQNAVIKVLGVGGGGGNAVRHMVGTGIDGVDFVCCNTDAQALRTSNVRTALQIGCNITKGLGAGANPDVGRQAAMEDRDRIIEVIEGADMLFITAGLGGGTGTGAAPVVAQVARELGILTVAVVTKPFAMEGKKRLAIAEQGIAELGKYVDSLITIPNEKLLSVLGPETTLLDAFKAANEVLQGAVQGIAELITRPGLINVDFADVRTVMSEMGMAMMGSGTAKGPDRAREAAEAAISATGGRQPVRSAGHPGERHRGREPRHWRVPPGRRDCQAVRLGRRDGGHWYGHRSRDGRYHPGDGGGDRPGSASRQAAAAYSGRCSGNACEPPRSGVGSQSPRAPAAGRPAVPPADGARRLWRLRPADLAASAGRG